MIEVSQLTGANAHRLMTIGGKYRLRTTFRLVGQITWKRLSNGTAVFSAEVDQITRTELFDFYANGWDDVDIEMLATTSRQAMSFWCHQSDRQGSGRWKWMTLLPPEEQHSDVKEALRNTKLRETAKATVAKRNLDAEKDKIRKGIREREERRKADIAVMKAVEEEPFKDAHDSIAAATKVVKDMEQLEAALKLATSEPTPAKPPEPTAAPKSAKTTKGYQRGSRLHLQFTTIQRENLRLFWEEYGLAEVGHNNMEKWFADLVYGYFMNEYDPKQGGLVKARLRSQRLPSGG